MNDQTVMVVDRVIFTKTELLVLLLIANLAGLSLALNLIAIYY